MKGKCEYCDADVIFITDQKGTKLPINKTRVRTYHERKETGDWSYRGMIDEPLLSHISHFVTCPKYSKAAKRMYGGRVDMEQHEIEEELGE